MVVSPEITAETVAGTSAVIAAGTVLVPAGNVVAVGTVALAGTSVGTVALAETLVRTVAGADMNNWSAMTTMSDLFSSIGWIRYWSRLYVSLGRTSMGFSSTGAAIMANSGLTCSASSTSMFTFFYRASRRYPKLQVKIMFYFIKLHIKSQ